MNNERYEVKKVETSEDESVSVWASEESLIPLPPADVGPMRRWVGSRVLARFPGTTAFHGGKVADMVSDGYKIIFDGNEGHEVMVEARYVIMHPSQGEQEILGDKYSSNLDYILELADPSRPSAPEREKRVQIHPGTFQCHLCPKKFTRAYNLRSHLRTHTDERPFVCNICFKAFARQHDRKRHESLHLGEKKFVCRGELGTGGSWGCGRRFARVDALGRHFRSEAGRVCIEPLLNEEAMERGGSIEAIRHMKQDPPDGGLQGGSTLPAALLAQYPALKGLQGDQLSGEPEEGDISGRKGFDASSEGCHRDEDEEEGGGGQRRKSDHE